MKTQSFLMVFGPAFAGLAADQAPLAAQPAPQPAATPSPSPSSPPKRSAADLEKLVTPIAPYPDPLLATMLPASVYPRTSLSLLRT